MLLERSGCEIEGASFVADRSEYGYENYRRIRYSDPRLFPTDQLFFSSAVEAVLVNVEASPMQPSPNAR